MAQPPRPLAAAAGTLILGAAGGGALALAGMPGGWIAGAMVAVALAALSGAPVRLPAGLVQPAFVVIGISMGSGVTPDTVARMPSWPVTMALVLLSVPAIAGSIHLFLTRGAGWDRATALLSSMPGALSLLVSLAPASGAHVPRVATLQTVRIAILVAVLPVAALALGQEPAPAAPPGPVPPGDLLLMAGAGTGGAVLAHLLRVPAGLLIGALFASALLHGAGIVGSRLPDAIAVAGFVVLGTMIGTRFAGTGWKALGRILAVSLAAFAIGSGVAVAFALVAAWATGLDLLKLLLAFAPGGLEAMVVLAFAMDLDPAFVAAHHLARFLLIALAAPFVLRWMGLTGGGAAPPAVGEK